MRREQQVAAGGSHHPVEAYPELGAEPAAPSSWASLCHAYEHALRAESEAWAQLRGLPGEPRSTQVAWERWRSAVEAREEATRLLINFALSTEG